MKTKFEYSETMPGLALEYVTLDMNRQNRRNLFNSHTLHKDSIGTGVVNVNYKSKGQLKKITVRTRHRSGLIVRCQNKGLIKLGDATAELVLADPQTMFVVFAYKYKKVGYSTVVLNLIKSVSKKLWQNLILAIRSIKPLR